MRFAAAFPGKPVSIVVSDLAEAARKRGSVAMLVIGCPPVMGVVDQTASEMRVLLQQDVPAVSSVF